MRRAHLFKRQARLGSVERADLAVFINRQHHGVGGRRYIQADDIAQFGYEVWIVGQFELVLIPQSLAIAAALQWLTSPAGAVRVRAKGKLILGLLVGPQHVSRPTALKQRGKFCGIGSGGRIRTYDQ